MSDKVSSALALAKLGFPVFPLGPNAKVPAITNWQELATTNPESIRKCWTEDPKRNIGIPTDGYVVIDVDPRNGGDATFSELMLFEEFPKTARAKTRGGGDHVIYALPKGVRVKGGTHLLGPGVDIKSAGGLIVAPGSEIDGKRYRWIDDRQVAPAPQWLIDRCQTARPARKENAGKRIVQEDDTAVELAQAWMKRQPAAELGTIDDTEYKLAARCYDFGCGVDTVEELLTEWCITHEIPTSQERLRTIAKSAGVNRENAIGARHPSASGFEPVEIEERPKPANQNNATSAEGAPSPTTEKPEPKKPLSHLKPPPFSDLDRPQAKPIGELIPALLHRH